MATTQIFDSYVTTATQDYILPKVVDEVLDSNVLCARLLSNPESFQGEQYKVNLRVGISNASAAQGGGFRGTDTFVTSRQNEVVQMAFNPKYVYEPINFVHTDLSVNMGKEKVLDIVARESEFALSNLVDNIGSMFYSNASETSKNFSGLQHIVASTGSYGGLNRATYTVMKPGNTSAAGLDAATTTLTLAAMRTVSNALDSGAIKTDLIVTTPAIFGFYEALLTPMQRLDIGGYTQVTRDGIASGKGSLGAATGFDALMWNGVPVVRDQKCTANYAYFLNTKYLKFYKMSDFGGPLGWKSISLKPSVVEGQYKENMESGHGIGFFFSGFKEPVNQATVTSQVVLAGELICTNPRRQGGFSTITA